MVLAFYLQFLFQFCGMNAVLQYSTTIFTEIVGHKFATYLTLLISIIKVAGYTYANVLSSKHGRRFTLLAGTAGMLVFTLLIAILSFVVDHMSGSLKLSFQIVSITLIFAFLLCKPNP